MNYTIISAMLPRVSHKSADGMFLQTHPRTVEEAEQFLSWESSSRPSQYNFGGRVAEFILQGWRCLGSTVVTQYNDENCGIPHPLGMGRVHLAMITQTLSDTINEPGLIHFENKTKLITGLMGHAKSNYSDNGAILQNWGKNDSQSSLESRVRIALDDGWLPWSGLSQSLMYGRPLCQTLFQTAIH